MTKAETLAADFTARLGGLGRVEFAAGRGAEQSNSETATSTSTGTSTSTSNSSNKGPHDGTAAAHADSPMAKRRKREGFA